MEPYKLLGKYADGLSGTCLEIGTERGHGSSTWLEGFIRDNGIGRFITIDPVPMWSGERCEVITGLAEDWLLECNLSDICFVYMDGADYHNGTQGPAVDEYSVAAHLEAAVEIEKRAAERCVIIFDDTNYKGWRCLGKGAFAVPYLIGRGFEVLHDYAHEPDSLYAGVVLRRDK